MRSKKASWVGAVLHPAFEVFMAIAVGLALLYFIHSLGDKTDFEKRFIATDLALLLDAIPAMPQPGALYLFYHPQRSDKWDVKYGFNFGKNKVEVTAKKDDSNPGFFFFTPDPRLRIDQAVFPFADSVIAPLFIKQGTRIAIEDINKRKFKYNPNALVCTGARFNQRLDVWPGHEPAEPGGMDEEYIASALQGTGVVEPASLIIDPAKPKLVLYLEDVPADDMAIKAFVHGSSDPAVLAASQRVACEIVNSLLDVFYEKDIPVIGAAVVPFDPVHTAGESDDYLTAAKGGVVLRFGSLKRPEFTSPDFQQQAALAIKGGIENAKK